MVEVAERKDRPSLSLGSFCIWSPKFRIRDEMKYGRLDKSNLEQIEEQWELDDDNIFDFIFMQNPEPANQWSRETQRLRSFWAGASIQALKDGDGEAGIMKVAILDQRARPHAEADPRAKCRQCKGPLTPQRLYEEMNRKASRPRDWRTLSFELSPLAGS